MGHVDTGADADGHGDRLTRRGEPRAGIWAAVLVALLAGACDDGTSPPAGRPNGILDEGTAGRWTTSAPAAQGLDEAILTGLTERVDAGEFGDISSLLVVRNGVLVYERYASGWRAEDTHPVYSVTKSVTSLAVGAAWDEGTFASLDAPVIELLPAYASVENWTEAKAEISLRHVLQMRAGFAWDELSTQYTDPLNPGNALSTSADWIKHVLDLPMAHAPGARWAYNSGVSPLMAGVLRTALETTAAAWTSRTLFEPLAIEAWSWDTGPDGLTNTGWGLWLRPRDMAALGQMVLDGGAWDGAQVVSAAWVEQSADRATEFVDGTGYGYQWWLGREDGARQSMAAWGYGGQFIVAIPGLDMVMVSTAENYGGGGFDPYALAEVAYQAAGRAPP